MAKEFIEREAALKLLGRNSITKHITFADDVSIYDTIKNIPAADVVEVVRCKNCYHYSENKGICTNTACVKSFYGCKVKEDDFCSYGERCENER